MNDRNRGFTLVELLVVTVLGAIAMAAVYQTLFVQEQSARTQNAMIAAQQRTRMSLEILASELREVAASAPASAGGSDLTVAQPESLQFRVFKKIGFVCDTVLGSFALDTWAVADTFEAEDSVVIFADGDTTQMADDVWNRAVVTLTAAAAAGCAAAIPDFATQRLAVGAGGVNNVSPGGVLRSYTWVTYGLYQIDGEWSLGRHAPGEEPVALIGPLAPQADSGLVIRYYTFAGATTANTDSVYRIEIRVRGSNPFGGPGGAEYTDTLTTQIFLRDNTIRN